MSMAILSNGSLNVILSHFPPVSGLWALACSTYFTCPTPFLYVVAKMNPIQSLPYYDKGFVNAKMKSRRSVMHLQNRLHFTSEYYQLHDHVSSTCTFPSPFRQSVLQGKSFPLCPVAFQHFRTMADVLPIRVATFLFCCQDRSIVFISHLFLSKILCCPAVCQEIYSDGLNMFACVLFFLSVATSAVFRARYSL